MGERENRNTPPADAVWKHPDSGVWVTQRALVYGMLSRLVVGRGVLYPIEHDGELMCTGLISFGDADSARHVARQLLEAADKLDALKAGDH